MPNTNTQDTFMTTLQDKLLNQSELISSQTSNLENSIAGAIAKVNESNTASKAEVESSYNRTIGYTKESNDNQITAIRERGVGVNTDTVAYKAMSAEADKQIKDLEQRKQELMLQGDAAAASKISDLILKTTEMKIEGMNKTFNNLLSIGSFGLQQESAKRQDRAQNFTEKQAISSIGLEYGIPVSDTDTIESIISKAAPYASAERKLKLAQIQANINESNAKTRQALSEAANSAFTNDPSNVDAMAQTYLNSLNSGDSTWADSLAQKNQNVFSKVQLTAAKVQSQTADQIIETAMAAGLPKDKAIAAVQAQLPRQINPIEINNKFNNYKEPSSMTSGNKSYLDYGGSSSFKLNIKSPAKSETGAKYGTN